jgi:hypothetical protein
MAGNGCLANSRTGGLGRVDLQVLAPELGAHQAQRDKGSEPSHRTFDMRCIGLSNDQSAKCGGKSCCAFSRPQQDYFRSLSQLSRRSTPVRHTGAVRWKSLLLSSVNKGAGYYPATPSLCLYTAPLAIADKLRGLSRDFSDDRLSLSRNTANVIQRLTELPRPCVNDR